MAETERENIRESTLEGLDTAARKGKHGGRPPVITDDMLHTVIRRRTAGESVEEIQPDLIIPTTYMIASTVRRRGCFSRRRPFGPVRGAGNNDSTNAHCSSVRSDGYCSPAPLTFGSTTTYTLRHGRTQTPSEPANGSARRRGTCRRSHAGFPR
jgi:hypothetical protein